MGTEHVRPHSQQVVSLRVSRDLCDTTPVQAEALQALAGLDSCLPDWGFLLRERKSGLYFRKVAS